MGESLQQERESPWALTLTERVPEAFEIPPSDWPEKYFSGQSVKMNSRATLMSSYASYAAAPKKCTSLPEQSVTLVPSTPRACKFTSLIIIVIHVY